MFGARHWTTDDGACKYTQLGACSRVGSKTMALNDNEQRNVTGAIFSEYIMIVYYVYYDIILYDGAPCYVFFEYSVYQTYGVHDYARRVIYHIIILLI